MADPRPITVTDDGPGLPRRDTQLSQTSVDDAPAPQRHRPAQSAQAQPRRPSGWDSLKKGRISGVFDAVQNFQVKENAKKVKKGIGKFFGADDVAMMRWKEATLSQAASMPVEDEDPSDGAPPKQKLAPITHVMREKAGKLMSMKRQRKPQQAAWGAPTADVRPPSTIENPRHNTNASQDPRTDDWFGSAPARGIDPRTPSAESGYQRFVSVDGVVTGRPGEPQQSLSPRGPVSGVQSAAARAQAQAPRRVGFAPPSDDKKFDSLAREQLKSLREHRPYFIYYMTFCQIAVMIIAILVYGVAPIQFFNKSMSASVDGKDGGVITIQYQQQANFWIGPTPAALVLLGAKFAPCMRKDTRVTDEVLTPQKQAEATFGCCKDQGLSGGNCFTGTQAECTGFKDWEAGVTCGGPQCCLDFNGNKSATYPSCERAASNATTELSCKCTITARPCCIGLSGKCEIQSQEYCDTVDGFWHDDKELCSQVNCFDSICGLIPFAKKDRPDQWYRLYLPLFIHIGVVQLFFVLLVQHSIAVDIEKLAGWLRMFFIYVISGIGGYLVSSMITPYQVSTGASPALFGLLASLLVELFQSWQVLERPGMELFKLIVVILIAFGVGLLPYVDNWAHLGGFGFGVLSSIVFLPYITFGKWDAARKRTLLIICLPAIAGCYVILLSVFYTNKLKKCDWCESFDCVDFVDNFCTENSQNVL